MGDVSKTLGSIGQRGNPVSIVEQCKLGRSSATTTSSDDDSRGYTAGQTHSWAAVEGEGRETNNNAKSVHISNDVKTQPGDMGKKMADDDVAMFSQSGSLSPSSSNTSGSPPQTTFWPTFGIRNNFEPVSTVREDRESTKRSAERKEDVLVELDGESKGRRRNPAACGIREDVMESIRAVIWSVETLDERQRKLNAIISQLQAIKDNLGLQKLQEVNHKRTIYRQSCTCNNHYKT